MLEITDEQMAVLQELINKTEELAGTSDILCQEVFRTLLQLHVQNKQQRINREFSEKAQSNMPLPMSPGMGYVGGASLL